MRYSLQLTIVTLLCYLIVGLMGVVFILIEVLYRLNKLVCIRKTF